MAQKVFNCFGLFFASSGKMWRYLIAFLIVIRSICSTKIFVVHWNTSNPIFGTNNRNHIFDVNINNLPFEYDQVNIICPVYSSSTEHEEKEKYIIYNVSKEEYETCRITNPNPRVIAVCDQPHKLMYFTITFRSFTPQPGGLEFRPGQDYYFISTSSKEDLHKRVDGHCKSHHMKVVFKVCCKKTGTVIADRHNLTFVPAAKPRWLPPKWFSEFSTYSAPWRNQKDKMKNLPAKMPKTSDDLKKTLYHISEMKDSKMKLQNTLKEIKEDEMFANEVYHSEELYCCSAPRKFSCFSVAVVIVCAFLVTTVR